MGGGATVRRRGGTYLPHSRRLIAAHGIHSATGLGAQLRFHHPEETAVYIKYVRWCGRTGPRGPSYPISRLSSRLCDAAHPLEMPAEKPAAATIGCPTLRQRESSNLVLCTAARKGRGG